MLNSINAVILALKSHLSKLASPLRMLAIAAIVILLAAILFLIVNTIWIYFYSRSYVNEIAFAFGWNRHAANALAWIVFAAMSYLGTQMFSLSKQRRLVGIAGFLGLLVAQSAFLALATRDQIIARDGKLIKCYVITRTGVIYGEFFDGKPTIIEPTTGRACRPVTPQLAERLRRYEKGERPTTIANNSPDFFDSATGEPIVWYHRTQDLIELFDLVGFHPGTGTELQPVTNDVVDAWRKEQAALIKRPPRRVDLRTYAPFDPTNGRPRVWYWRSESGEYEFYDGPGFHSGTGAALDLLTAEALAKQRQESAEQEEKIRKEQEQRAVEALARKKQEDAARAAREEQERAERTARELQRQKDGEIAQLCDQLAGNPNDPRRVGDGVPYELLRSNADTAIAACERATQQLPHELRLRYQLGRAVQIKDRRRAAEIHQQLVNAGYPAAFDNLGWIHIQDQNYKGAVALFLRGVTAGDPDSMFSLADMIERGHFTPPNPTQARIDLLLRARQLGHAPAAKAIDAEEEKERQRSIQLEDQRKKLQMMMELFKGIARR